MYTTNAPSLGASAAVIHQCLGCVEAEEDNNIEEDIEKQKDEMPLNNYSAP